MERRKFNIELLTNKIKEDNAELIGDYPKITRNININFKCSCNNISAKNFRMAIDHCGFKCKDCTIKQQTKKFKDTLLERYGVTSLWDISGMKDNIKNTSLLKYGTDCPSKSINVRNKIKETNRKRYGTDYGFQNQIVKQKIKAKCLEKYGVEYSLQSKEVRDKGKETNIEKYGTEVGSQSEIVKQKIKATNLEKYGSENPFGSPEIKEKIKATLIERYGVEHPMYIEESKEKMKKTSLERYGVEYPTQLVEIQEKAAHTAKSYKNYTTPTGNIIKVQGFEPFALDELYKLYSEDDIITDRKLVPKIEYIDNDIKKFYFPDIYIKSINKIIEVKSTWTYKTNEFKCTLKGKACIENSYIYELWIYDKKGKNKKIVTTF